MHMKKLIGYTVGIIILLSVIEYVFLSGFDKSAFSTININLITNGLSVLVTVLIVDKLLKKQQEKENEQLFKKVSSNEYRKFISEISNVYIAFVTKKTITTHGYVAGINDYKVSIEEIIKHMDTYIKAGFRSVPVKVNIVDLKNLEQTFNDQSMSYQVFCEGVFKPKIKHHINQLLNRYISVLPESVRNSILTIENSLDEMIFITPLGLIGNEQPLPTTPEDIIELKKNLEIIGEELLKLIEVINE
ncbi:hypothetical protein COF84_27205 [Bacillus wiedmannii]|uniref:hypothetical protein n=1 Tax=Bacillus wiedmannii TaxID=1890302 RepID=UPI000BFB4189|nr:hypothetical protein [Bacillus wiedmannii]PHF10407.1 hypothetical protein COF84_27205 [Bacillus wiedmannii]